MKKFFSILILAILIYQSNSFGQGYEPKQYTNPKVVEQEDYKNGNIYQKDFLLFLDLLQTTHPGFAIASKEAFNIDSVRSVGYQQCKDFKSNVDLEMYLQSVAALLKDGHTGQKPNLNKELAYPFSIYVTEDKCYLSAVDQQHEIVLGKEITSINNQNTFKVLNSFGNQVCADNKYTLIRRLQPIIHVHSLWEESPYHSKDSTLKLTFIDSSTITLKPQAQKSLNIASVTFAQEGTIRQKTNENFLYKIIPEKRICYLQFNQCQDQNTIRQRLQQRGKEINEQMEKVLSKIPVFETFLEEMFQEIKDEDIQTLVVDVRDNSGGNSGLCDLLLSYLKNENEIKTGTSSIRVSHFWEAWYPEYAQEVKNILIKKNKPYVVGKLYSSRELSKNYLDNSRKVQSQENSKDLFKGEVVFIQNKGTYSSAGLLTTKAKDNGIGTLIGSNSTFRPTHFGDLLIWELPNTKLLGFVSHKIFYRPDKTKNDNPYLIPDVIIPETLDDLINGKDRCWEYILNNY